MKHPTPDALARAAVTALTFALLVSGASRAAEKPAAYPTKPIRLIVPFAPGGGTDIAARLLSKNLTESLRQPVIIDNRPGAAGTTGVETAIRATPDGYTLLMISTSYATSAVLQKLPYDPVKDIAPIALMGHTPFVMALHPGVPARSVRELVALAKAKPKGLNYGSSGTGGIIHLATELFDIMAGTQMVHIPYKGSGAAMNDLLGGQIQMILSGSATVPHLKSNRLRGIAVTTARRTPTLPEIPTVAEAGVPGYEAAVWYGLVGPRGLNRDIVTRLNSEVRTAMRSPELRERMAADLFDIVDGGPQLFGDTIRRDIEKWRKVVETARITIE